MEESPSNISRKNSALVLKPKQGSNHDLGRQSSIKDKDKKKHHKPSQEQKMFEIDHVGTGTYQVSQENILHRRSLEPIKNSDALLSARGLHHRSKDVFVREVQNASGLISSLMRREKVTSAKYKPSPQLMAPHFQRALAFERLQQVDRAIDDYSMCIRVDGDCSAAYFNRSGMYKVKGDLEHAIEDMNHAIRIEPANVDFRAQRSLLYRLRGSYVEAVRETLLGRALLKQPGIAETLEAGGEDCNIDLDGDLRYAEKLLDDPIVEALTVLPGERKEKDLEPIVDFLKNVKVFSDVATSAHSNGIRVVAQKIQMVAYAKEKFIFEENQPGNHFYIVLDGEVSIVKVRRKERKEGTAGGMHSSDGHSGAGGRSPVMRSLDLDSDSNYEAAVIWKYYRGQSFGETALESKGGLRTAGAKASQPSRLLVLHADEYLSILHELKAVLREEVRVILRSSTLFEEWSDEKIDQLSALAIVRNYGANTEILKAGAPVNSLMMIKSGIVKLIKAMPKPDVSHIKLARDAAGNTIDKEDETPGLWVLEKNWRHRLEASGGAGADADSDQRQQPQTVEFTVGVLGSGQVFGELAVLDPEKISPVAALSSTAVEIYCFDSETMALMDTHMFAKTMNILNESLTLHDPPVEKVAYYFRAKYNWELRKSSLMNRLTK